MAEPTIQQDLDLVDGLWIDPDTGEVVREEQEFRVTDEQSANWVLEKILNAEADEAREQMKLTAIEERLRQNMKAARARADWFRNRYGAEIEEFARKELEGKKTKTLKLPFGSVSFRATKGGLRVDDPEKALEWARERAPEAIKVTETFQISQLPDEARVSLVEIGENDVLAEFGFTIKPDTETCAIKTGVNSR